MALLRMPAIESLQYVLELLNTTLEQLTKNTCAACGYPVGDLDEKEALIKAAGRLAQAATQVLDRTGMGPSAVLDVRQSDGDFNLAQLTLDEKTEFAKLLGQFKHLKLQVRERIAQQSGMPLPDTPSQTM